MTDKTAREAAQRAQESANSAHEWINIALKNADRRYDAKCVQIADLQHKFNLLMEFLNAEAVEIPAHTKIQKVKR